MKLVFICFGFESNNLRKQPWRYVDELTRGVHSDVTPVIVTDTESDVEAIPVRSVSTLESTTGPSEELVETVRAEAPDVVATVLGPSSFVRPRTIGSTIDVPTVGVMTSPLYGPREMSRVGLREFYRHSSYLIGHLVGALTPNRLVRRHLDQFDRLVTLTQSTRDALSASGTETPIDVVPPGLDPFDLSLPAEGAVAEVRDELAPDGESIVLYFTSPLTLRGTDTLVRAFARVREATDAKLVILSRQDDGGLSDEEQYLRELGSELGIEDSLVLLPRNLTPRGVKRHLRASDVVALPYKIVISGVPISVLETMAVGRPVVTTRIDGLPELVGDPSQLVAPNDVDSLATTLEDQLANREDAGLRNRNRMREHSTWRDSREGFLDVIDSA